MNPARRGREKPLLIGTPQSAVSNFTGVRHDRSRGVKKQNVVMTAFLASLTGYGTGRQMSLASVGWIAEIHAFGRAFLKAAFDSYRPEQHYMRGPGPACAAKAERSFRS
jgi:hypothetical protein